MLHAKGIGKLFDSTKTGDEWVWIAIGDLQAHTEQHREDEE